jgi:hypothetical protein
LPSASAQPPVAQSPDVDQQSQVPLALQWQLTGQHCAAGPEHLPLASSQAQTPWSQTA